MMWSPFVNLQVHTKSVTLSSFSKPWHKVKVCHSEVKLEWQILNACTKKTVWVSERASNDRHISICKHRISHLNFWLECVGWGFWNERDLLYTPCWPMFLIMNQLTQHESYWRCRRAQAVSGGVGCTNDISPLIGVRSLTKITLLPKIY